MKKQAIRLLVLGAMFFANLAQAQDPCETSKDCGSYETCASFEETMCPDELDMGCMDEESDDECAARIESLMDRECELKEGLQCLPVWLAPCEVDSECGEGFHCSDRSLRKKCEPVDPSCSSDDDCLAGWKCALVGNGVGCESGTECLNCVPPIQAEATGEDDAASVRSDPSDAESVATNDSSSGCSVAHGESGFSAALALLTLAGLFVLRRRKS